MSDMTAATKVSFMQRMKQGFGRLLGAEPETGMDALPVRVHGTEFTRTAASPVHVKGFDQPLVWVTFALLMFGLVMVYSASIAIPDNPRMGAGYTQTHFLVATCAVAVRGICRCLVGVSNSTQHVGAHCAVGVHCRHRVVDCGVDSIHWQISQRRTSLDWFGLHELPAV